MNSIDDVIEKDAKFLLRFLKENHLKEDFFTKFLNGKICKARYNFKDYLSYIHNNDDVYISSLNMNNSFHEMLINTDKLILSVTLFGFWDKSPYVYGKYNEAHAWHKICHDFRNFKQHYII